MSSGDAWAELVGMGLSPFKVVCSAHSGTQLVERGGAQTAEDGFVSMVWLPRGASPVDSHDGAVVRAVPGAMSRCGAVLPPDTPDNYSHSHLLLNR